MCSLSFRTKNLTSFGFSFALGAHKTSSLSILDTNSYSEPSWVTRIWDKSWLYLGELGRSQFELEFWIIGTGFWVIGALQGKNEFNSPMH